MDHGFSFFWPAGRRPYLLLPNGHRLDLTVEGKIPYLTLSGSEALGRWMCAVAAGSAVPHRAVVLRDARRQGISGRCGIGGRSPVPCRPESRDS